MFYLVPRTRSIGEDGMCFLFGDVAESSVAGERGATVPDKGFCDCGRPCG